VQISAGTSNASAVDPGFDYGDYDLMSFSHGVFYRTWADNSNSTGDNPNGTAKLDIYTASVSLKQLSQTALVVSATNVTHGQPVTFTATVTGSFGTPTGFVTFKDFGVPLATIFLSGGVAMFTTTGLGAGSHQITAVYSGDSTYLGSSSSPWQGVFVAPAATQTGFRAPTRPVTSGQPITLTAIVGVVAPGGGVLTGTITFFDGATALATVAVPGAGKPVSVTLSGPGTHTLFAIYSGDANFTGSTSPSQNVFVGPGTGGFAAALAPSASAGPGQTNTAPSAAAAAPAQVLAPAAPADLAPARTGPLNDLLSGGTGAPADPATSELAPPGVDHRRNPEW
jgi:hypothetical protein